MPPSTESAGSHDPEPVTIRGLTEGDRPFFRRVADRLLPATTVSPRDPAALADHFRRAAAGEVEPPPGTEHFVAVAGDDAPLGLIALYPDKDYFTGHRRAYVELLVVAEEAEGRGVGRALMAHAEAWARERGCAEVVLDVFADNERARAFYERVGYRADHIRMAKRLAE